MTSSKPGLTIARHQEIGLELANIRDRLTMLSAEIGNAYAKASALARLAHVVPHTVDQLRVALDSAMFTEHPDDDRATTNVYYPSPATRRTGHVPFHQSDLWCCSTHAEEAGSR